MKAKSNIPLSNILKRKRHGFSLVELVIVIIIVAVLTTAVFVGGDKVVKKSKTSRTISDMHNFSVAAETTLNELPTVVNIANNSMGDGSIMKTAVEKFNNSLGAPFKLESTTPLSDTAVGNIQVTASTAGSYAVFQSKRTDAWSNPFFVIFDCAEREEGPTEFYITVISAGPNSVANVGGQIESDDIFMIAEYSNSQVRSMTFNAKEIATMTNAGNTVRINSDNDSYPVALYASNTLTNNRNTSMPTARGTVDTNVSGTAPAAAPAASTPTPTVSPYSASAPVLSMDASGKVYATNNNTNWYYIDLYINGVDAGWNDSGIVTGETRDVRISNHLHSPGTYSITARFTQTEVVSGNWESVVKSDFSSPLIYTIPDGNVTFDVHNGVKDYSGNAYFKFDSAPSNADDYDFYVCGGYDGDPPDVYGSIVPTGYARWAEWDYVGNASVVYAWGDYNAYISVNGTPTAVGTSYSSATAIPASGNITIDVTVDSFDD